MKKLLSFLLISVFLLSAFSTAAFAAAPQASDFVPATGYIVGGVRNVPTISQESDGVKVMFGGYYSAGADIGGAISAQKVDLNGFEVTVRLDQVHTSGDCWYAFDFLVAQRGFYTDNFNPETGNQGMINLLRPNDAHSSFTPFEGITSFSAKTAVKNDFFKFKNGDVVTLTVNRTPVGNYTYTFKKAGVADPVKIDYEFPMDELFPDGKAYFGLFASSNGSAADAFVYTITDMKNGAPLTPTDREAIENAKQNADADAVLTEVNARINTAQGTIDKAIARATACGSQEALAKANAAATKLGEAKTAVESGSYTLDNIKAICSAALDLANEANKLSKDAEKAAAAETETETETQTETATTPVTEVVTDDAQAKDGGFPVWAIALIAGGAVVIVAVVVLVVIRKKKSA